ncbi:transposase [Pseudomonas lundensis]|uniref:transposase n=1 Tax=Pseudomonas lundensis TaxID=86185 RepID=UPI000A885472
MLAISRCQVTKQRRLISVEFKREHAGLVLKQNYSFIEVSRSLGVSELVLCRWVSQLLQECTGITPKTKVLTPSSKRFRS